MLAILGVALAFNIIVIIYKLKHKQTLGGVVDLCALSAVALIFSGSFNALVVGTIGSAIVSIYLYVDPPHFSKSDNLLGTLKKALNL